MEKSKPDLVIIYGPGLTPTYRKMLAISEELEAVGQNVVLIPPPNKDGTGPEYGPEDLTVERISEELDKNYSGNDKEYTVYKYTHGIIRKGEHYSGLGELANSREIIQAVLKQGNCKGIYDASCFSGASLKQMSEELEKAKLESGEFEFVSDAPVDKGAWVADSKMFFNNLAGFAQNGMEFTPSNLQKAYLVTLGDSKSKTAVGVYRSTLGLPHKAEEDYITFHDLKVKLEKLIDNPDDAKDVVGEVNEFVSPENLVKLKTMFAKGTNEKELRQEKLWGDAILLADYAYPAMAVTMHKSLPALHSTERKSFVETFIAVPPKIQAEFTKSSPQYILEYADYLLRANVDNQEQVNGLVRQAAKTLSARGDSIVIEDVEGWQMVFSDPKECAAILLDTLSHPDFHKGFRARHMGDAKEALAYISESGLDKYQTGGLAKANLLKYSDFLTSADSFKEYFPEAELREMVKGIKLAQIAEHPSRAFTAYDLEVYQNYFEEDELADLLDEALVKADLANLVSNFPRFAEVYNNKEHLEKLTEGLIGRLKEEQEDIRLIESLERFASDLKAREDIIGSVGRLTTFLIENGAVLGPLTSLTKGFVRAFREPEEDLEVLDTAKVFKDIVGGKELVKATVYELMKKDPGSVLTSIYNWSWSMKDEAEVDQVIETAFSNITNEWITNYDAIIGQVSDKNLAVRLIKDHVDAEHYFQYYGGFFEYSDLKPEDLKEVSKEKLTELLDTGPEQFFYGYKLQEITKAAQDAHPHILEAHEYYDLYSKAAYAMAEDFSNSEHNYGFFDLKLTFSVRAKWQAFIKPEDLDRVMEDFYTRLANESQTIFFEGYQAVTADLSKEKLAELTEQAFNKSDSGTVVDNIALFSALYGKDKAIEKLREIRQEEESCVFFSDSSDWAKLLTQQEVKEIILEKIEETPLVFFQNEEWVKAYKNAGLSLDEVRSVALQALKSTDSLGMSKEWYKEIALYDESDLENSNKVAAEVFEEGIKYGSDENKSKQRLILGELYPELFTKEGYNNPKATLEDVKKAGEKIKESGAQIDEAGTPLPSIETDKNTPAVKSQ